VTRGRLLFPFLADVRRRDPAATTFDPDFRESVVVGVLEGPGVPLRAEAPPLLLPCQVEPAMDDELRMEPAGNTPRSLLRLVFHFADLEARGLVDTASGEARLRPGDRVAALLTLSGGLVRRFDPGLFALEARGIGWGLGGRRNLLLVTFTDRPAAAGRSSSP
jgi:hypothetical protein